ncbi:S1 family peptidase [Actinoplanes derwentensis]|uniref:S1 family peptidase n=1 Tax=Actinoplanes derwentensis TaxID=113562 RepID=UPI001A4C35CE|nr:trypsin-like serine protease [Actinoplanes derwentensis]GID86460.1 esterase [Actinoplanes derwentensis]
MVTGVLVAATATFFAVAGTGTANAIANGEPVAEGEYRFNARLVMTGIPTAAGGKRNSGCSGALIAEQWVITAGHCFRDANGVRVQRPVADSTVATIGKADVNGTGEGVALEVIEVRQSTTADVALAKLASPVEGIEPIAIADAPPAVGDTLRLTGYGSVTSTNPVQETRLRTGQLTVLTVASNIIGVRGASPSPDTTPCPHDSGGPFFVETQWSDPELVSIVSNGPSCPHTAKESSARVDNLKDWITAQV